MNRHRQFKSQDGFGVVKEFGWSDSQLWARPLQPGTFAKGPAISKEEEIVDHGDELDQIVMDILQKENAPQTDTTRYHPLATVQTIRSIDTISSPHIDIAKVLGWEVAVPKGHFETGEKAIYISLGSIVNTSKLVDSYSDSQLKDNAVKSIRIGKDRYSEGVLLRKSDLLIDEVGNLDWDSLQVDDDVTENLDIRLKKKLLFKKFRSDTQSEVNYPEELAPRHAIPHLKSFPHSLREIAGKEIYLSKLVQGERYSLIWGDSTESTDQLSQSVNMDIDYIDPALAKYDVWANGPSDEVRNEPMADIAKNSIRVANELIRCIRAKHRPNWSHFKICSTNKLIYNGKSSLGKPDMLHYCRLNGLVDRFKGRKLVIQGFLCGPKIHRNSLNLKANEFFVDRAAELDAQSGRMVAYSLPQLEKFVLENNALKLLPIITRSTCDASATDDRHWDAEIARFHDIACDATIRIISVSNITKDIPCKGIVIKPVYPFQSAILNQEFNVVVKNPKFYSNEIPLY